MNIAEYRFKRTSETQRKVVVVMQYANQYYKNKIFR
jgi:hypothetical protein